MVVNNSPKRNSDHLSPPAGDVIKRYTWNPEDLLKNNPYYPLSNQETTPENNPTTSQVNNSTITKIKIPPIFIHKVKNHNEIISDIKKITEEREFTTTYSNNYLKVNLTNHDDYRKLTKYYMNNLVEFHTFQDPHKKQLSVVIKNVPISLTDTEIKEELISKNLPIVSVTRLINKDKKPIPICAVILTANDVATEIYNIKTLNYSVVTVEPRRKTTNIPQCHKCQRYGHTKNYCAAKPRCVKCNQDHPPKECTKTPEAPPICVNCSGNHPASYKGCPHHQELLKQRYPIRNPSLAPQRTYTPSNSPNSIPYNQAANPKQNPDQASFMDSILKLIQQLIIPHLAQIKTFITTHILPHIFNV